MELESISNKNKKQTTSQDHISYQRLCSLVAVFFVQEYGRRRKLIEKSIFSREIRQTVASFSINHHQACLSNFPCAHPWPSQLESSASTTWQWLVKHPAPFTEASPNPTPRQSLSHSNNKTSNNRSSSSNVRPFAKAPSCAAKAKCRWPVSRIVLAMEG